MIELHLRAADLADTSFTISAVQETVFSLWVWRSPGRQPAHLPWRAAHARDFEGLDTEMLDAIVVPGTGWVPDFLTPRGEWMPGIEDELEVVRATPARRVRAELTALYEGRLPPVLSGRTPRVLTRMVDALAEYWRVCLQPHWPRMRSVLEADVVHRSRQLAISGASGLFGALDWRVQWDDGLLRIDRNPGELRRIEVAGRGVRLSPSLFCRSAVTYVDLDEPPWLVYPARGIGTVWEARVEDAPHGLVDLLGRPRAGLLTLLGEPLTTTELAHRTGVSPSAVSQHLRVLHAAGLTNRARSGRSVLYLRSELADRLLGTVQRPNRDQ